MPIRNVEDLRRHLVLAARLEATTIPPYLYALYSIEDRDSEAAVLIRSVVVEEMLHLALVTNILLAVGGEPDFAGRGLIPSYPCLLPHHAPDLPVHLAPASVELVRDVFTVIEIPKPPLAAPEDDEYESIGQFYLALEDAIVELGESGDLFARHQPGRQLSDPAFYVPVAGDAEDSGGLVLVEDVASALEAIEIIVHQGEGLGDVRWADPAHQELTHYFKFLQIVEGVVTLGAVRPAITDPRRARLPGELEPVAALFDALYRYVFLTMGELFTEAADKAPLVGRLYRLMTAGLPFLARYLMEQPLGDGSVAGPGFEHYDFGGEDPARHLIALARRVSADHPALDGVADLVAAG